MKFLVAGRKGLAVISALSEPLKQHKTAMKTLGKPTPVIISGELNSPIYLKHEIRDSLRSHAT